ncbi:MAG: tRNA 2-thiocytidine biosynthesis protein TtcA [Granulosicoccus sp.]
MIPCNLCGSQPNLQRQAMKQLLAQWEKDDPTRISSMLGALGNVAPSHLLDRTLFDFDTNSRVNAPEHPSNDLPKSISTKEFPLRRMQ